MKMSNVESSVAKMTSIVILVMSLFMPACSDRVWVDELYGRVKADMNILRSKSIKHFIRLHQEDDEFEIQIDSRINSFPLGTNLQKEIESFPPEIAAVVQMMINIMRSNSEIKSIGYTNNSTQEIELFFGIRKGYMLCTSDAITWINKVNRPGFVKLDSVTMYYELDYW